MGEAKKKQIECPVVGRRIKPAECGENRCSTYECPANCPQNPWNPENYDRSLEVFDRCMDKIMSRFQAEQTKRYGYSKQPPVKGRSADIQLFEWYTGQFFRVKDAAGQTFKQRWEAEHYRGLNNDQRLLFERQSNMRVAALEIRRIIDDRSVMAVDLLDPEQAPFILLDRALAAVACRFSVYLTAIYQMPHYVRTHSIAVSLPDIPGMPMREVLLEIARHLGAPEEPAALQDWLLEHISRVTDSIYAVNDARRATILRGIDAAYTKSVYELRCKPEKFRAVLEQQQEDIEPTELKDADQAAGFTEEWVCLGEESPTGQGRVLIGRILLNQDGFVQLEAMQEARAAQLKERMESLFGAMLEFNREQTDDLGKQLAAARARTGDAELVPERLLENPQQIEMSTSCFPVEDVQMAQDELEIKMQQEFMNTFLENSVPALENLTPREAAKDPAMRPRLIELMKSHVRLHDESNLETGRTTDINWMLEELGLDEINSPPPPPRKRIEEEYDDQFDEEVDDDLSPFLLTPELLESHLEDLEAYSNKELIDCLSVAYPEIKEQVLHMTRDLGLEREEPEFLKLTAELVFLQSRPRTKALPGLNEELVLGHLHELIEMLKSIDVPDLFDELAQPHVAFMIFERLREILRFGENNPDMLNVMLFFIAISEAVDQAVCMMMLEVLQRNAGE